MNGRCKPRRTVFVGVFLFGSETPDSWKAWKNFSVNVGDATAVGFGLSQFGYMDIALTGGGDWTGRMLDRKGKVLAQCDSSSPSETGACSPAED